MSYQYRNLTRSDLGKWVNFHTIVYGANHILNDLPYIKWFLGSSPDSLDQEYETLIATTETGEIAGTYGVLPAKLRIRDEIFSFCWYVSGMVHPDHRNKGIGKKFVDILLDKFDFCGVISFNEGVRRNYERFGFHFFENRTLRRYIKILNSSAFDLVEKIGFDKTQAAIDFPVQKALKQEENDRCALVFAFEKDVVECVNAMRPRVKCMIVRSSDFLNWRYILNPRIHYEIFAIIDKGSWKSYIVARREQFQPTNIYGSRVIDMAGKLDNVIPLLKKIENNARERGDSFIDYSFTGNYFEECLNDLHYKELIGTNYGIFPLVSSPIEKRENHEYICIGSKKYDEKLKDITFSDLYFTRGDADRDRANRPY